MTSVTVGVFTVNYELFTNAQPGNDIQFGMDFNVTTTSKKPLAQVIFPATAVGANQPLRWNVDNHSAPTGNIQSIVFNGASGGTITDTPREIVKRAGGIVRTKFAVFLVDVQKGSVLTTGISFGYNITPTAAAPRTVFEDVTTQVITNEQKQALSQRFPALKFN